MADDADDTLDRARKHFAIRIARMAEEYKVPQDEFAHICGLAVMLYCGIASEVHEQEKLSMDDIISCMADGLRCEVNVTVINAAMIMHDTSDKPN